MSSSRIKHIILFFFFFNSSIILSQEITSYYLIRHAEKNLMNPDNKNPHLIEQGKIRASNWKKIFKYISFDKIYSTNYSRTQETARPAAVLILLFPFEDEIQFFLTKRTEDVEHHKGQISLPGGIRENNESLHETALRETKEEVGIDSTKIIISGSLTPFFIPVTGYIVHPFIGWCKEKPSTKIHDVEP